MVNAMTMRQGLENMVKAFDGGSIEHALITTFNFDPGFFEKNVLPLLCGLTLDDLKTMSLDALGREMYHPLKKMQVTIAYDQAVLQGVSGGGIRYSFLPRHQKEGFFHAKLFVLTGVDAARQPMVNVMVGSGNMTLSGWGSNIEVAAWVKANKASAQELLGFYRYLDSPDLAKGIEILEKIKSVEEGPRLFLQYPATGRGALFDRIFKPLLSGDMHILSPYWSEEAIKAFMPAGNIHCYPAKNIHGYQFALGKEVASQLGIRVNAIRAEEKFRHAKAYCWQHYMAIGSANCTSQALHSHKNVEAMLLFTGHALPNLLAESLQQWDTELVDEEGIKPAPLFVLVVADYKERCYHVELQVTQARRCSDWKLLIGDDKKTGNTGINVKIPFIKGKPVARVYRVSWHGEEGEQWLTGMIIPRDGNDVELGYRPKRNLDKIFEDMLRHKMTYTGGVLGAVVEADHEDFLDVEGDEEELSPKAEDFDFDMYGMYQSFYHLKRDACKARNSQWKVEEISDTLLEIMQAVENSEVSHVLQQWLIVQEVMDVARLLPDRDRFIYYRPLCKELDKNVRDMLKDDEALGTYCITSDALLEWLREELDYAQ